MSYAARNSAKKSKDKHHEDGVNYLSCVKIADGDEIPIAKAQKILSLFWTH
jgi:hypothetical protein